MYPKYIQLAVILLPPVAEENFRQKSPKHNTCEIHRPTDQWDIWEQPQSLRTSSVVLVVMHPPAMQQT